MTAIGPFAAGALALGALAIALLSAPAAKLMPPHAATPWRVGALAIEAAVVAGLWVALWRSSRRERALASRVDEARGVAEEARLRFQGVFDHADDLMLLLDDRLAVVDANRAAVDYFGKRRDELLGASSAGLVAPADRGAWGDAWRPRGSAKALPGEASLLRADGSARLFELRASPNVGPRLHLASLRDVGARRQTEQLARFLDDASDVLASSLHTDETLAAVARLAVPRVADGMAVDLLGPSEGVRRVASTGAADLVARVHGLPAAGVIDDADGAALHRAFGVVSSMCVPLRVQGRPVGAISLISAQSGRRFGAEDLSFAQALAHRASAALENARTFRESQEANRVKDEFLATISHELRTPLNAILGWTTMMRRKPDVDAKKALDTIERNARAQMRLVEDVLDVSRAVTGKLKIEPAEMDVVEVVRAAMEVVAPMADARLITLEGPLDAGPLPFYGDADRLQQAFWNVLSNAIKFTGKGGRVSVRLVRGASHVELVVSDTGRGINAEFMPFVFDRFRQADSSTTRAEGGLGLGLAIVRHIVDLHGGTVRAESRGEGYGTTFTVSLPVRALQGVPPSSPPRVSSGIYLSGSADGAAVAGKWLSGIRILVCDDDEDARELLGAVLVAEGASVETAAGGTQALQALRDRAHHVLISDVGMPHVDGYELIRQVRAMPEESGGQTPAIALTAYARREDELKAFLAGYQVHVAKPVEPGRLVQVVANLVGRPMQRDKERPGN